MKTWPTQPEGRQAPRDPTCEQHPPRPAAAPRPGGDVDGQPPPLPLHTLLGTIWEITECARIAEYMALIKAGDNICGLRIPQRTCCGQRPGQHMASGERARHTRVARTMLTSKVTAQSTSEGEGGSRWPSLGVLPQSTLTRCGCLSDMELQPSSAPAPHPRWKGLKGWVLHPPKPLWSCERIAGWCVQLWVRTRVSTRRPGGQVEGG